MKELHSPEQQHTCIHRLFIKLCWLMEKHAVSAVRVVNIDETSCHLLLVRQTGWGRHGAKQAQLQGNTKEATTFTVAFSMDRGPLDMLVQIVHAGKTDTVLTEQPWLERTHHVTSENGWATTTTILQLAAALDDVMNPSKEGQSWILLCDISSIDSHANRSPSRGAVLNPATKHVEFAALRRGRLPQLQELQSGAGVRHSCPLCPRWLLRRLDIEQGMAAPVFGRILSRVVTDLCEKDQAWTTGWSR